MLDLQLGGLPADLLALLEAKARAPRRGAGRKSARREAVGRLAAGNEPARLKASIAARGLDRRRRRERDGRIVWRRQIRGDPGIRRPNLRA